MNSFGRLFRLTLSGESHGAGVLVVLDGVPAGISLRELDFEEALFRRRPSGVGATARREADALEFLSGVFSGRTTGAPLGIFVRNGDVESSGYVECGTCPRPGHADFVAGVKYFGYSDFRGGGMFSGRMTVGLVVAGVVARKIVPEMRFRACLQEREVWERELSQAMAHGDSVGGIVECCVCGIPVGLGEPFFDSVESLLSHLLFSIPGVKGVEFGVGFGCAQMFGSEYNDVYVDGSGRTLTNNTGGVSGGISNGNALVFRVAVRPPASIARRQESFDFATGEMRSFVVEGRHDASFAPRVPVIVESAAAIVLADLLLLRRSEIV